MRNLSIAVQFGWPVTLDYSAFVGVNGAVLNGWSLRLMACVGQR